jgi:superoxide dismutase, Fe-Mn family
MQSPMMIPPGQHQLPPLPYPYNALEPVISSTTLHYHHDIHHKTYVDDLNKVELKLVDARKNMDFELIKCLENELAFNGSGHILHSIYWTIMTSVGRGGQPGPQTLNQINSYFGSFNAFKEQFSNAAIKVQGSGWAILTWQPTWKRLEILQSEKHQNGTQWSGIPILVLDVWEHAYYLDYQNRRKDYVKAWWQLVNWNEVERRLLLAAKGQVPLTAYGL